MNSEAREMNEAEPLPTKLRPGKSIRNSLGRLTTHRAGQCFPRTQTGTRPKGTLKLRY